MGLCRKFERRAARFQESKSITGRGGLSKWLFSFALYHIGRASLQPQCSADGSNDPGGLGQIGVKANIIINEDISGFIKSVHDGKYDAMLAGYMGGSGDPDDWVRPLSCTAVGTSNFSKWCHKEFEDVIRRAAQITDVAERTQLYTQAQKIFKREQPFTPIAYATDYQVINKRVTGFKMNPLGPTIFSGVGLRGLR